MQGYISIHRKIKEWRHYKEPAVKAVFLDLLLDAAHIATVQSGVRLAVGECISSTRTLAANNGLAAHTVTKVLNLLIESGEIARRRVGNTTIFKILKYADYQGKSNDSVSKRNTPKSGVLNEITPLVQVWQNVAHDDSEGVANENTPVCQNVIHSVAKCDTPPHYNITIKECNNKLGEMRTHAQERIDNLRLQVLDGWSVEQACYTNHIDKEQYAQLAEEIFSDWLFALDECKPEQPQLDEINKKHFLAVLRIKAEILNRQINDENNRTDSTSRRRGSDTTATRTQDYETDF